MKAAPFGHNAPLKPIYDERGRIINHEECLLGEPVIMHIRLYQTETPGWQTDISFQVGAKQPIKQTAHIPLDESEQELDFGDFKLQLVGKANSIFYEIVDFNRKIAIFGNDDELQVQIDTDDPQWVLPGSVVRYSRDTRHVTIESSTERINTGYVTIKSSTERSNNGVHITVESSQPDSIQRNIIALDGLYEQIVPLSWVVIEQP